MDAACGSLPGFDPYCAYASRLAELEGIVSYDNARAIDRNPDFSTGKRSWRAEPVCDSEDEPG